ncbi:Glutathione S-transferase kappa 1 [Halocaridina rubra]|uniref:Glutathione S-transferase kappa n=1 Tax=Halocaridina rubra TaxID=373956 RepID=A0AAN9ADU9_HALRR
MATKPQKRLEFYYDVISPYSWFAFEVLMRYKKHWDIQVDLKPFLLAGVMKSTGNAAPMLVPNRGVYMFSDLSRNAKYFNVPLKVISDPHTALFERGSLTPNRFLTAVDLLFPEHVESVSRALWSELWNKDEDITSPETLIRVGQSAGLNKEQLIQVQSHMSAQVTKDRLKNYTTEAVEYGAFGSPTIIAHYGDKPMLFFGSDRFPVLAQEIGEKIKLR